jgi:hypothetical protein
VGARTAAEGEDEVQPSREGKTPSHLEQEGRQRAVKEPRPTAREKTLRNRTEKLRFALIVAVAPVVVTALLQWAPGLLQALKSSDERSGDRAAAAIELNSDRGAVVARKIINTSSVRVRGVGWKGDGAVTVRFNGATDGHQVFVRDGEFVMDAEPWQVQVGRAGGHGRYTVAVVGEQSGHLAQASFVYWPDHRQGEIYEDGTPAPGYAGLGALPSNQAPGGLEEGGARSGIACWPDPCRGEDGRPGPG